jgi:hypothetical protein
MASCSVQDVSSRKLPTTLDIRFDAFSRDDPETYDEPSGRRVDRETGEVLEADWTDIISK